MDQFFIRLANARKLPRTLALCVIALGLPTLSIGLLADDFVLAQRVRTEPFDAFKFFRGGAATNALREQGLINWSASHDLRLHLLRPLSSLSHALDFALWPDVPWIMHLENVLLYAALVFVAARLYAALLGDVAAARLAAMFYAFTPGHAVSVGWVSSRNTLLCALLGLLSVLLFVRSRRLAALGVHALAHLAGEAALGFLALLLAYALTLDEGTARSRTLRVLPHLLLCAGYLAVYTKLGFGAAHGGTYLNVLQQPAAVAANLALAVPLYLHSSLLVPNAGLAGFLPSGIVLLALLTCLCLALLAPWLVPSLRSDKHAQFFLLTALGSILPLSAVTPQDRLVFFVGFGGCGLLAACLSAHQGPVLPWQGLVPRALFKLHTSGAVLAFVPLCFIICIPALGGAPGAIHAALDDAASRDVVVLNVPIETAIVCADAMVRHKNTPAPRSIRALYVGGAAYKVQRVDARSLDVEVEGGWFRNAIERIVRDPNEEPFAPGDEETTDIFRARVLQVDAHGAPLRVRFQFIASLDDPRWVWLRLDGAQVRRWQPPAIAQPQHLAAAGALL